MCRPPHAVLATWLGGALLLGVPPPRAGADVAGRGTFTVEVSGTPSPPNVAFQGDIVFDSFEATPFGTPVNLGPTVGTMTFSGSAAVADAPPRANFTLTADDPDSSLAFAASGAGVCDEPDCVGGTVTFAGRLDSITLVFVPNGVYAFDGTAALAFPAGPGGACGLNVFPSIPTATGPTVKVASGPSTYFDSREEAIRTFEATATFDFVSTAGGTSFVGLSAVPGSPPEDISLFSPLSVFVDVETTAVVSGPVRVCIAYADVDGDGVEDGSGVPLTRLRLLHATLPTFADVTDSVADGFVCGSVPGLSAFVLGASESASTTTTISSATTTTTLVLGRCGEPVVCLELALASPLCSGEQINPKLQAIIAKKLRRARNLLRKAGTVPAARVAKLIAKARKQLAKVGEKADAFVARKRKPISVGCRDRIRAALDQIGATLTANPPTGSGGSGVPRRGAAGEH